ncbi:MAG: hypothetical protein RR291_01965 [Clostridia bacterium]
MTKYAYDIKIAKVLVLVLFIYTSYVRYLLASAFAFCAFPNLSVYATRLTTTASITLSSAFYMIIFAGVAQW